MGCKLYKTLEAKVQQLTIPVTSSTHVWNFRISGDSLDKTALIFRPNDAPEGRFPIHCGSDGNCFCRAISRLIYGNEDHHREIRIRIAIEAVTNKNLYLNDTYLTLGQSMDGNSMSRKEKYSIYSQCYQ